MLHARGPAQVASRSWLLLPAWCFPGLSALWHLSAFHSFSQPNNTPSDGPQRLRPLAADGHPGCCDLCSHERAQRWPGHNYVIMCGFFCALGHLLLGPQALQAGGWGTGQGGGEWGLSLAGGPSPDTAQPLDVSAAFPHLLTRKLGPEGQRGSLPRAAEVGLSREGAVCLQASPRVQERVSTFLSPGPSQPALPEAWSRLQGRRRDRVKSGSGRRPCRKSLGPPTGLVSGLQRLRRKG